MNENQLKVQRKLNDMFSKGEISLNKYREVLDVCLAALEEPEQASEPKQTGLTGKFKNLVQVKKNKKDEAVHVPVDAIVKPTVQGEIKFERLEGAKFIREPDEKDEYAEISARLNEMADKLNKIYANVNKLKEPVIKNKTLDDYPLTKRQLDQVVEHVSKELKATNTTVHYTGGQLTEEQANEFLAKMKNDLAKSIREDRLKGGYK